MHEFFSRESDPIDSMLHPPPPAENEPLRQAVYMQTQRVLHRRLRFRQFAYAASLLLSFAAGAGVMWMTNPGERDRVSAPMVQSQPPNTQTPSLEALTQPRSPESDDSALAQEWVAFDSTERRGELYRQAGDHYKDENDLQSALRCYSNALDSGTEQDLDVSPNDNWLLMAIKSARQKEKNRAKQDD